jgi:hypothetical protein
MVAARRAARDDRFAVAVGRVAEPAVDARHALARDGKTTREARPFDASLLGPAGDSGARIARRHADRPAALVGAAGAHRRAGIALTLAREAELIGGTIDVEVAVDRTRVVPRIAPAVASAAVVHTRIGVGVRRSVVAGADGASALASSGQREHESERSDRSEARRACERH